VLKAVIDSNVFISALLTSTGKPRQLVNFLENSAFALFHPKQLIVELRNAPFKPKLADRVTPEQVGKLVDLLERKAILTEPEHIAPVSRDPKDDVFVACAAACSADFLVTGDDDLLSINEYRGTKIVSPAQFLYILVRGE
jgi:putative PIN family toxin of toxin-antitoxin system